MGKQCALGLCLAMVWLTGYAGRAAAAEQAPPQDDAALTRRITEQVLRELKDRRILEQAVREGIERFVREQRAAQSRAAAQRTRAAAELAKAVRRVSPERDHVLGAADAELSLIEYSDYECPFCKRFHATARAAVEKSGGKLNWAYRHFPLAFHNPLARKEAEAAECAAELGGNGGFWRYSDAIFERTRSNGRGFPIDGLTPLAAELGFDEAQFRECLDSGSQAARVKEHLDEGAAIGISGTPGNILVNNRTGEVRVVPGAVPPARLQQVIDDLLAKP